MNYHLLNSIAPEEIARHAGRVDTCILSTAVAIDVLDYYGIDAVPVVTEVVVANRAWAERFESEGFFEEEDESWWERTGAHTVGLGFPVDANQPRPRSHSRIHYGPGMAKAIEADQTLARLVDQMIRAIPADPGWPGHLVAYGDGKLIDLSIGQASRPSKGILLAPIVCSCPGKFLHEDGSTLELGLPNGALLLYQARPSDRSYRHSVYWTRRERHALVGRVIRRMNEQGRGAA